MEELIMQIAQLISEINDLEQQISDYKIIIKFLTRRENKLQQIETMFKNKEVDLEKLYKLVMDKKMRCKLREDKQDEFVENYEYQSYKYANKDDCYYLKISKHLILDQDTLEILVPTNKLEQEDIDLIAKLDADNMLEFYKEVSE